MLDIFHYPQQSLLNMLVECKVLKMLLTLMTVAKYTVFPSILLNNHTFLADRMLTFHKIGPGRDGMEPALAASAPELLNIVKVHE